MVRALVVDDSKVVRIRVAEIVSEIPGIEVVGSATNVDEGCSQIDEHKPDLVLIDIRMPGGSGMDVLRHAKERDWPITAVMLTNFPYQQYREKCVAMGADAFLDKSAEFDQLIDFVRGLASAQDAPGK